ncbi:MAG: YIP1 family protein [Anaerolineales bacterium]|nr:YIP1 family protein [Anaerolineales bacterium]NUQ85888.1 YIP1 family protein [Anaerolineales bacterium]
MTDTTSQPVHRFSLPRFFAVLFRPRSAFAEMASESRLTWSTPMLVLSVTALLVVLAAGYLKTRAAMMGEITLPPDWQWWTPEMQERYMRAQQATQGPVFAYVIPLVGAWTRLWVGWLVLSGLLHLGSTLSGGRGTMQGSLNVVAWANVPFALRDILRLVFMLVTGRAIANPGLSGFTSASGFVSHLLTRTDIFLVWSMILLVVGLAAADGLTKGKSFAIVLIVLILFLLTSAGLDALGSGLSGSVIQRPFF